MPVETGPRLTRSSSFSLVKRLRIVKRRKMSVPKALMFMYLSGVAWVSTLFSRWSVRDANGPAHRDQLRAGQVLEGQVVLKEPGDTDDLLGGRLFTSAADLYRGGKTSCFSTPWRGPPSEPDQPCGKTL
jgi:hypothetical protein